jgi:hypothetical protein
VARLAQPAKLAADWMMDRFADAPLESEKWYVRSSGEIVKTPI